MFEFDARGPAAHARGIGVLAIVVLCLVPAFACSGGDGSPGQATGAGATSGRRPHTRSGRTASDATPSAAASGSSARSGAPRDASSPPSGKPNFVVLLTDDLDVGSLAKFERLAGLAAQGVTFAEHFVSLSLCCPSRASLLRGQYAHDTGVFVNQAPRGGFEKFHAKGNEESTLATWLHEAGYRTGMLGKYLNGFPAPLPHSYVPPGWTTFATAMGKGGGYGQYDYDLVTDGKSEHHGDKPEDYLTDLLGVRAKQFIDAAAAAHEPFFLYVAPYSPHTPATPAPRYADAFSNETQAPRGAAFNEADVSDKPKWLKDAPLLSDKEIAFIDKLWQKRLRSMLAVQDLADGIVKALEATGTLDNTYVIFSSDNGFHLGQHRLAPGKNTEFDTDLRVPLFVRGPGVPAGKTVRALTANVDLAPTIAELAGVKVPDFVEGRSLAPWLRGETPVVWRKGLLLEHAGPEELDDEPDGAGEWPDHVDDEDDDGPGTARPKAHRAKKRTKHGKSHDTKVPIFAGVRTPEWTFVEYADGEKELYDVVKDPDELDNLAAKADPAVMAKLRARTQALVDCHGAACRAAEEAP